MILAIEGAPGAGKSTTADALSREGAYVVPEVNRLFAKPNPQPSDWYHDRQTARWEMARLRTSEGTLSILDGDPLQPIWFGWIFSNEAWPAPADSIEFYRSRFIEQRMMVPDRYVFLHIAEDERRQRMLTRERSRGLGEERAQWKTARYASLVAPQMAFFRALSERFPGWVAFIEAISIDRSVATIRSIDPSRPPPESLEVLDFIGDWIATAPTAT